jgi:hypothetical protein
VLISALDGGEWSVSRPRRFISGEKAPLYPLDRRLGGPQRRSGRRGESSRPYRDTNSGPSVVQPVASRYTDYVIPAPVFI